MSLPENIEVQLIPIDNITIINPRSRGQNKFRQITENIGKLGLKKPITVTAREGKNGHTMYNLVCGQGRLEAYKRLGQQLVPAIIVDVSREELLLMSLAENLARKKRTAVELAKEIAAMKERGHDFAEIARKTDLKAEYVRGVIRLLEKGEEHLLRAVESGQIPITVAITIASSDDDAIQRALTEAYENKSLRGKALLKARRMIELRRAHGKTGRGGPRKRDDAVSSENILKTYNSEMNKHRLMVNRAKVNEAKMLFIVNAMRSLLKDENFVNVLRAERLDNVPAIITESAGIGTEGTDHG